MRKYAAILCALALVAGLCACKKADKTADTKPTTTTTTTAADTEEPAKAPLNLTYASPFSDGVAFVRYLDADGVEHTAAINTAADILFEVPADMSIEGAGYQNGIRVVGNIVYDKTGAVIASPEMSGYDMLMTGNCGGYVLAKKVASATQPAPAPENSAADSTENTTDAPIANAVTLSMGVLNNKGEWVHPLSADHPIAAAITAAAEPAENFTPITDGVLMVHVDLASTPLYYHFADNTLTADYVHYTSVNYQDEDTGIYQQAADGTEKRIIENVISEYFFKTAFIGRAITLSEEEGPVPGDLKLYDYKGKVLMDLAAYPLSGTTAYYVNDYLLIPTEEAGARRLVLLNKEGKPAFDPVVLGLGDRFYAPDATGFVVESHSAEGAVSYRHYDYLGNVTDYTDVVAFSGFTEGLAAVTLTDNRICYINHKAEIVIQ